MATAELRVSISIAETAETVWAAATAWSTQGEWMMGTEVHVVRGDGGLGSSLAAFTGLGGVGVLDRMEIVEWRPPVCCRVRHVGKLIVGQGGFDVIRDGPHACTFVWWERLSLPTAAALVWPLVRPALRWGLERSLRRFAALCPRYREGTSDG